MAKNANATTQQFDLRNFGYEFSSYVERGSELALKAKEHIAGFPNDVSDESKAEFFVGVDLRQQENRNKAKKPFLYSQEGDDVYIPITGEKMPEGKQVVRLDIEYAMSYTGQAFGKIKAKQPNLHSIVGEIRTAVSQNRSQVWNRLVASYNAMQEGETRKRSAPDDWSVTMENAFKLLKKKFKPALARGDKTVPSELKFNAAVAAFKAALK
jgi:hypothetical protein